MAADLAFVVLAAGKGTRFKTSRAKVLHEAGGLPLLAHVLRAVGPAQAGRTWVVVGHRADKVGEVVNSYGARTVLQKPQLGTGHAITVALRALPARIKKLVVLPGDAPLLTAATLRTLVQTHNEERAAATLLTAALENPDGYGRILRAPSGEVQAIMEQSALTTEQRRLKEINASMYCFERGAIAPLLKRLGRGNVHREYYLTDVVALLVQAGQRVAAYSVADAEEILGVNTQAELAAADAILRRRKAEALMAAGVTLYQPETLSIDPDVVIGPDTVVERGVELRGATRVGAGCHLGPFSVLVNARLGDRVTVRSHSLVLNSRLADDVSVGPFAHLRDGADIHRGARIGNYVEVKKSLVGEGTKAQHLTYLGDATVGGNTNIGAGTITCNYDGVNKNPTRIGDNVFVGSGTMLVAPVKVGRGGYVAAGSTVTDNVPAGALAIARGRQVNKPGWARTRRQKLAAAKARKEEPTVLVHTPAATAAATQRARKRRPMRRRTKPRRRKAGKPARKPRRR